MITCENFEIQLADYLDGTLDSAQKTVIETHAAFCVACGELLRDCSGVVAMLEEIEPADVPVQLIGKILRMTTDKPAQTPERWFASLVAPLRFTNWSGIVQPILRPVLQPRVVMSVAMAALSLVMIGRFWGAAENNALRAWNRTMKRYENLAVVYDVQSQLDQWSELRRSPQRDVANPDSK